jgi:hypothetical protein
MQQDGPRGQEDQKTRNYNFIETVSRDLDFMLQPKYIKSPIQYSGLINTKTAHQ